MCIRDRTEEQKTAMTLQLKQGQAQLQQAKEQIAASEQQLEAQKKALSDAEAKLAATKKSLDAGWASLNEGNCKLTKQEKEGRAQLEDSREKLDEGWQELAKAKEEYEKGKAESDAKLKDAEAKLNDAQKQIDSLKEPKWYVLDRNTNAGFVEYGQAADRMNAISKVFPVFFFLIAALVCLTTMTRMVDEQRSFVGTVKALGYSKLKVASKYLWYAASASILGSTAGVLIGFKVFPTVIFNAYRIMFTLPPVILTFDKPLALISGAIAVAATTLSAYVAVNSELLLTPALLMRPKAPKPGKRIFMERVSFVWKCLSFIQKVTVRNLFRYKKRFLMTILGVSGCTALLVAGFGLKDSISDIVGKQYSEIFTYQMSADLNEKLGQNSDTDITEAFKADSRITDWLPIKTKSVTLTAHNHVMDANAFVPLDSERIGKFISLRDRNTKEPQPLTEQGVVLTEKLARKLGVSKGEMVSVKEGETLKGEVKVIGITENYIDHYMYISPALYEKVFGEAPEFERILGKTNLSGEAAEDSVANHLLSHNCLLYT
ncbi:MAG: ABC transporter permease, partial [Clostridia bacterium]|nr:ABC transporter permease [Clostridia bacterium]